MPESTAKGHKPELTDEGLTGALPRPATILCLKQFARACATITAATDPLFWIAN